MKTFYETTRGAKKIVVVDLGFLGDTVHLVPALWELKRHYPQAELHVVTTPVGAEVLRMAPCVDRAWPLVLDPAKRSLREQLRLIRGLRREKFDVAYNFNGGDRTAILMALVGAREAMAYQSARKHFWQPWIIRHWIAKTKLPVPVYEARREILARCGLVLQPARFDLRVPNADQQWAQKNIPSGAVHLSLSASFALKEWPLANNLKLVRQLLAEDFRRTLVLTAAPNPRERARAEQVRREIQDERLLLINDGLPVTRVAALLERCSLHVGPDSGVVHLAAALGILTIGIFRRYADMADWLPTGPKHAYFDAPCACISSKNPPCETTGESACLGGIAPELVVTEIRRHLSMQNTTVTWS